MAMLNGHMSGGPVIPRAIAVLVCLVVPGCGGGSPGPSTEVSVRFSTSTDLMFIGATQRFTAAVVRSDETSHDVMATFTSSTPQLASVDVAGVVTAHANGLTD